MNGTIAIAVDYFVFYPVSSSTLLDMPYCASLHSGIHSWHLLEHLLSKDALFL